MKTKPSSEQIKADAKRVYDCITNGGVAICHYDVSYAILCGTDDALKRVYAAKGRSMDRASGVVGSYEIHEAVHELDDHKKRMVKAITKDHNLPLSVIAPFKPDHPFISHLTPFLFDMSTRDGTVNFLLNAGELRDYVAELCWKNKTPFIASSANASLKGTKYRVEDIEPEVIASADIVVDYGPSKHMQPRSISSTQIDFRTMKVVRYGLYFDEISEILRTEFDVMLTPRPAHLY